MTVQTNASTALAIAAASPATYNAAGFDALSYTTVGEVVSLGEHGGTTALVTHSPLARRRVNKFKGSINDGSMTVGLGLDIADAGQVVLAAGADGTNIDLDHSIRITYQDGSISYFTAKIMSYTRNPGTIDSIVGANSTFELTNQIVDKAAP